MTTSSLCKFGALQVLNCFIINDIRSLNIQLILNLWGSEWAADFQNFVDMDKSLGCSELVEEVLDSAEAPIETKRSAVFKELSWDSKL